MAKKLTKAAVIGCGAIGTVHAERYQKCESAELACVVDILGDKARKLAEKTGAESVLTDYHEMLADPSIQAVSVCLPNHLHCPVTIDCLNAGKNVLCEKPIAMSVEEAEKMRDAAKENDKLLAIGVVNRFKETVNFVRDSIADGDLGEVYHVQAMFKSHRSIPGLGGWFTTKGEAGGGVMIDWGVHFIDLILYCLDFPTPKAVSGVSYSKLGTPIKKYDYLSMWAGPPNPKGTFDVEEYASALVRTDGANIALEGAWAQNIGEAAMYIDFIGDKGGVRLEYMGEPTVYSSKKGVLLRTEPSMRKGDMFQKEIDSFVDCVATGKKSRSHIDTVLASQKILDGFYASAKKNAEVSL